MFSGDDVSEALDWVRGFQSVRDALAGLDPTAQERAVNRLRTTLAAHRSADRGVLVDSRALLVTTRRR